MTSPDLLERKRREQLLRRGGGTHELRYCRHDRQMVQVVGPSPVWRWVAPAIGVVGFLLVIAAVFVDPIGILALLIALLYIATLGPAIALARRTPRCSLCGREAPYHTREEAEAAERHGAPPVAPTPT